jgi:hypothetical protein
VSADKARSLVRRVELLSKAETKPIEVNCQGGMASTNRDLRKLVHDGHLKQTRVVYANKTHTAFEITASGRIVLTANRHVLPTPSLEDARIETWLRDPYGRFQLQKPRPALRSTGRGYFAKEERKKLAQISSETARLVSAALLEAEKQPFVADTGWIEGDAAAHNPLNKVLDRGYRPDDGFTLCDRLSNARTLHLKRYLKDDRALPSFELLVVRTLGGGAVVCRFRNDDQAETYALCEPIQKAFLAQKKIAIDTPEPVYPQVPVMYRLLMLASSETMATYLQLGFR